MCMKWLKLKFPFFSLVKNRIIALVQLLLDNKNACKCVSPPNIGVPQYDPEQQHPRKPVTAEG